LAVALCAASSGGCVSRSTYDAATADLAEAREQASVSSHETEALRADVKRFEAEAQRHRAEHLEMKSANAELTHKVDDLVVLNAEMTERLKGAGHNVEQLATERGSLRQALTDTRAELAEWRRQQQVIAARSAQQRQLTGALQQLIETKGLQVGVRHGRVVVIIPSDHLFDPGMTAVKPAGRPMLAPIAGALRGLSGRSFRIAAHTDTVKSGAGPSPNWQLTAGRSMTMTRELISAGVPPERLSAAAHAEYDPVDANDAEPARGRNRRIEIVLVPLADELVKPVAATREAPRAPSAKP
jgi:chemotaxis protein MotB